MTLEKGPGTKQDLLFSNPEKLFQSTVVLGFDEDSPSFRQKLVAMDENVEGMRNHLQRLVFIIQKYIEAGLAFSTIGRKFSSEVSSHQSMEGGMGGDGLVAVGVSHIYKGSSGNWRS